jgi:hypothetical protein
MVIWNGARSTWAFVGMQALTRMDDWLAKIVADTAPGSARERVLRNKPPTCSTGVLAAQSGRRARRSSSPSRSSSACAAPRSATASTRLLVPRGAAGDRPPPTS